MILARLIALFVLSTITAAPLFAQETAPPPEPMQAGTPSADDEADEDAELAQLLTIIDEETKVATKTLMNSDYVPGIVNVFAGDELEALGAVTVWDALALIPGVQPILDGSTRSSVIVRGTDFPFNAGNIKILIDSVAVTQERAGINPVALHFPIEQVERIEFIRGPGSVVYGDFAFMGLINIITRKNDSRISVRGGSDDSLAVTGRGSWRAPGDRFGISAGVSRLSTDDGFAPVGRSIANDETWGVFNARAGRFAVSGSYVDQGLTEETTPLPAGVLRLNSSEESWAVEGRYEWQLTSALRGTARVAHQENDLAAEIQAFEGAVTRYGVDAQWERRGHSVFAAVEFQQGSIDQARLTPPNPPNRPPNPPTVVSGVGRQTLSFTLQDRWDVTPKFSVTAGLRYDDHSDVESRLTPRLAGVWRLSDRHVLKAQYAEGFRPPTFFELYAGNQRNEALDFETNATTELNYIYRRAEMVVRGTLFHAEIEDMIFPAGPRFGNERSAMSRGVELEWSQQFTPRFKVMANAARFTTEDERDSVSGDSANTPDLLGSLAFLVRPAQRIVIGTHWQHVGERAQGALPAYDMVNVTATRHDLFFDQLDLRGGVRNVLGDSPAFIRTLPTGLDFTEYSDDRTYWLEVSWRR
jgi:outer membrane receptor for ferrienterochelin and colicins